MITCEHTSSKRATLLRKQLIYALGQTILLIAHKDKIIAKMDKIIAKMAKMFSDIKKSSNIPLRLIYTMLYKCCECSYYSVRKSNISRHLELIHKYDTIQQSYFFEGEKIPQDPLTLGPPYKCTECYKLYLCKKRFLKHTCKQLTSSLECQYCHHEFKHQSSKCKHEKKCSEKEALVSDEKPATIIHNYGDVHNTYNIDNTTINNNVTILLFNSPNNEPIEYKNDHLDNHDMLRRIFNNNNIIEGITEFAAKLLEVPENQCVKKTNPRLKYSLIHYENDKWKRQHDDDVYPRVARSVTSNALGLITKHKPVSAPLMQNYTDTMQTTMIDCEYNKFDSKIHEEPYDKRTEELLDRIKIVVVNISDEKQKDLKEK